MSKGQYKRTPEIREKMRKANVGKKASPETKKKFKEMYSGEKNPMFGKTHSDKTKKLIGIKKYGKKVPKISGQNHYNWKGGRVSLNIMVRKCFKYRQWRSDVFSRDDYTCQICGVRGGTLNADHIKLFSKIMDENKITSLEMAENCEELWNINNGRTLCLPCHYKTDGYGGGAKRGKKYNLGGEKKQDEVATSQ